MLLILIAGCVKERLSDQDAGKSVKVLANISEIKRQFYEEKVNLKLVHQFTPEVKTSWEPNWEEASSYLNSKSNQSSYLYIPLIPHVEKDNKDLIGIERGNRTYLMIKDNKEYFKVIYSREINETVSNEDPDVFNFKTFTGTAVFINLVTGNSYQLNYKNGVSDYQKQLLVLNKAKVNSLSKIKTEAITTECHTEYICTWTAICHGRLFITVNLRGCSPPNSGAGSCLWHEVDWYQSDTSPREVCGLVNVPDESPLPGGIGGTGDPSQADHSLKKDKLPTNNTKDRQLANTCVFKSMEWIDSYFDGKRDVDHFLNQYAKTTGPEESSGTRAFNLFTNGVPENELNTLVTMFFDTTPTTTIKASIDSGYPLMGTITTDTKDIGHEVMITGYNNNGSIQYFDPQLGKYDVKPGPGDFTNLYTITGRK